MLKKTKFKGPFDFCPSCGSEITEDEISEREMCSGCGITAFKLVQRYIRFYDLFAPENFEDWSDRIKMD